MNYTEVFYYHDKWAVDTVDSSEPVHIVDVYYNIRSHELFLADVNGDTYGYENVPVARMEEFEQASQPTRYWKEHIHPRYKQFDTTGFVLVDEDRPNQLRSDMTTTAINTWYYDYFFSDTASSVISSVFYDARNREMVVCIWPAGKRYRYSDVPLEVYQQFRGASSRGSFYNYGIKNVYSSVEISRDMELREYNADADVDAFPSKRAHLEDSVEPQDSGSKHEYADYLVTVSVRGTLTLPVPPDKVDNIAEALKFAQDFMDGVASDAEWTIEGVNKR